MHGVLRTVRPPTNGSRCRAAQAVGALGFIPGLAPVLSHRLIPPSHPLRDGPPPPELRQFRHNPGGVPTDDSALPQLSAYVGQKSGLWMH